HPQLVGPARKGVWPKLAALVSRRPRSIWIASALILVVAAGGMLGLKADGVSQNDFVLGVSQARDGQAVLGKHFPGGSGTPAIVIAPQSKIDEVASTILGTKGVSSLTVLSKDSPSGSLRVTADGVQASGAPGAPAAKPTVIDGAVMFEATLDGASDSNAAEHTVSTLRSKFASKFPANSTATSG